MGRAAASIELTTVERRELESLSRARKTGQAMGRRARIVLTAAAGLGNKAICAEVGADANTVSKWRRRFAAHRLEGLLDERRPGTPRKIGDDNVAETTLGVMLGNGTITPEMRDAGELFRRQFRFAALDTLRAMPLIRIPGGDGGDTTTEQQFQARERVAAAMDALGGPGSPAGACVWHVVGPESSITEWARRSGWGRRPIGHAQGQGVLVSALGVLAGHSVLVGRCAA